MTRYLLGQLLSFVVTLWAVLTLVFVGVRVLPGDAATVIGGIDTTPAQVQAIRRSLGLDRSLPQQYASYWSGLVRGDLGTSLRQHRSVDAILLQRLPVTATLAYGPTPGGSSEGPGSNECTAGGPRTSACPVVELNAAGVAKRRAILVSVRVSSQAPVSVDGRIGWRVRRRPRIVDLEAGEKTVGPDRAAHFRVPLPNAVLLRLAKLRPQRSLRARIAVTVTDKVGEETNDEFVVKLHGHRRAARHAHTRHHRRR